MNRIQFFTLGGALLACVSLASCANTQSLVQALAADPSAVSVHEEVDGPGWTQKIDVTRVNSTNTAATASSTGTAVNVPSEATVNPAPQNPIAGVTKAAGTPSPSGTTLTPASP